MFYLLAARGGAATLYFQTQSHHAIANAINIPKNHFGLALVKLITAEKTKSTPNAWPMNLILFNLKHLFERGSYNCGHIVKLVIATIINNLHNHVPSVFLSQFRFQFIHFLPSGGVFFPPIKRFLGTRQNFSLSIPCKIIATADKVLGPFATGFRVNDDEIFYFAVY